MRDGEVLASLERPMDRKSRARGLLGRTGIDGAMWIAPARSVHSIGMSFDLDIALLDSELIVIKTLRLRRRRVTAPVWRATTVVEAEAGAFGRWDLKIGDKLEIRD